MTYESRYDWSGERARRARIVRRMVGITIAFITVSAIAAVAALVA